MKRVSVYTENMVKLRRIELILGGRAEVVRGDGTPAVLSLVDTESMNIHVPGAYPLPLGPISHVWLLSLLDRSETSSHHRLTLTESSHEVMRGELSVSLTEVEYRLFSELFFAEGYLSRDELCFRVWGGVRDAGVVNVYIHYLREKLEQDGERVIISSRREGYKIDEKYERITLC